MIHTPNIKDGVHLTTKESGLSNDPKELYIDLMVKILMNLFIKIQISVDPIKMQAEKMVTTGLALHTQ